MITFVGGEPGSESGSSCNGQVRKHSERSMVSKWPGGREEARQPCGWDRLWFSGKPLETCKHELDRIASYFKKRKNQPSYQMKNGGRVQWNQLETFAVKGDGLPGPRLSQFQPSGKS